MGLIGKGGKRGEEELHWQVLARRLNVKGRGKESEKMDIEVKKKKRKEGV